MKRPDAAQFIFRILDYSVRNAYKHMYSVRALIVGSSPPASPLPLFSLRVDITKPWVKLCFIKRTGYLRYGCDINQGRAQLKLCQDPSCWIWISVQREPCFARFCLAWMTLLSSYPSGRAFAKRRMISRPLGQCLLIVWVVHRSWMHPTAWAWLASPRTGFQKVIPLLLGLLWEGVKGLWHLGIGHGQGTQGGREKFLEYETPDNLNWILKFTFWKCCLFFCWSWTNMLLVPSYWESFLGGSP